MRKQLLPAINAYMSEVANTAASKLAVSDTQLTLARTFFMPQGITKLPLALVT